MSRRGNPFLDGTGRFCPERCTRDRSRDPLASGSDPYLGRNERPGLPVISFLAARTCSSELVTVCSESRCDVPRSAGARQHWVNHEDRRGLRGDGLSGGGHFGGQGAHRGIGVVGEYR